jgi:hypothetical protein
MIDLDQPGFPASARCTIVTQLNLALQGEALIFGLQQDVRL